MDFVAHIGMRIMDEVNSTECPRCGEPLDLPEGCSNGQRLLCPYCGTKFRFQESANVTEKKGDVVGATKISSRRRFGTRFQMNKRNVIVVVAFCLATYLCVVMTITVCKIQAIDTSVKSLRVNIRMLSSDVGSLESDVSSMKSDVDSIESDMSHIKIWGVQISR